MKRLKITQLENNELNEKEMTNVIGGVKAVCFCMLFEDDTTDAAYSPLTRFAPNPDPGPGPGGPGGPGPVCICFAEGPEAAAAPSHYRL